MTIQPRRSTLAAACALLALGPCIALAALAHPSDIDQADASDPSHSHKYSKAQDATPDSIESNAAQAGSTTLPTITVTGVPYRVQETSTGTGINTSIINIPQSIHAISRQVLRDQAATSLAEAVRNAPGISVQQGEGNRDEFYVRGVKMKSNFFMDGLRDDTWYYRPLYNVAHVDVLEGPAAILFGRGGAGGLINVVTRQPVRESIRHFTLDVGSWGQWRSTFDVGNAVGKSGAFRLMGMGEDSGGFRDHYFVHRWAINPKYSTQLGDRTQLDLGVSWLDDTRIEDRGIPSRNGRPADVPRDKFFGAPDWNQARTRVGAFNMRIRHQLNDHVEVRNALLATKNIRYYQMIYPGGSVNDKGLLKMADYRRDTNRTSYLDRLEMVANFGAGAVQHKLLAGGEFSWQRGHDQQHLPLPDSKKLADKYPVSDPIVAPVPLPYIDWNNRAVGKETGVYAQDQISFGEHWEALLGARWDRFTADANYLKPGVTPARTDRIDAKISPRAGLIYKPVENDSLYASVTRTFTPQGTDIAISAKDRANMTLDPEQATNVEIGNKLELRNGKLSITAALFQLDLTNVVSTSADGSGKLVNTGKQRNRGYQVSLEGAITPRWNIYANYTHLKAEITSDTADAKTGSLVEMVPRDQASIWMRYALSDHWGMAGGLRGESWKYTKYDNSVVLPGYVVADLMAWYQATNYRVQLNVGNVTDRTYFPTASGNNEIMPGEARSVTLSLSMDL